MRWKRAGRPRRVRPQRQYLRVLMRLESPYCGHDGLNLTWEMLEGWPSTTAREAPTWALAELDAAFRSIWPAASLEAQVAAISDDIAYDNHDIDDGLRAGFLTLDDLLELPSMAEQWRDRTALSGCPRERCCASWCAGRSAAWSTT
jgi:dGTPase